MEPATDHPSDDEILVFRDGMLRQMDFARQYTLGLLESVPEDLWGVQPQGFPTHFAWQVGHLAMAQYGLMLFRMRGRAEGDVALMPGWMRKRYSRGSVPATNPGDNPPKSELLACLDRIHAEAMAFAAQVPSSLLREPTEMPYTGFPIKLGALLFCPLHESIHAGQIGLLRRAHGLEPVR
ncbi:MAG: DinB family protein [Planctomycetota bacterium]